MKNTTQRALTQLTEENEALRTTNQHQEATIHLMRYALTHALCGRNEDAWAIVTELGARRV